MDDKTAIRGAGDAPLRFAEKLLALLDTGRFTATYKFATLVALIDVCVESVDATGTPPQAISARRVGRRVLEVFWRHAISYKADLSEPRYLRHSTQRGDLVSKVTSFREQHDLGPGVPIELAEQRFPEAFADLEDHVVVTIIRMPLPKLQRFGLGAGITEDRFLYDYSWPDEVPEGRVRAKGFDDTLYLQHRVGEWLVRLAGVFRPIVQQRWASFVADRSRDTVEDAWLDEFLFGSTRVAWTGSGCHCLMHNSDRVSTAVGVPRPLPLRLTTSSPGLVIPTTACTTWWHPTLAATTTSGTLWQRPNICGAGWNALSGVMTPRSCLRLDASGAGRSIANVALVLRERSTCGCLMGRPYGRAWAAIPLPLRARFGPCSSP